MKLLQKKQWNGYIFSTFWRKPKQKTLFVIINFTLDGKLDQFFFNFVIIHKVPTANIYLSKFVGLAIFLILKMVDWFHFIISLKKIFFLNLPFNFSEIIYTYNCFSYEILCLYIFIVVPPSNHPSLALSHPTYANLITTTS